MASSRQTPNTPNTSTYGSGKDYTEGQLSNWEAATDTDLVTATAGEILDVYKEGAAGGLWDETPTVFVGATTNSSYYRLIRAVAADMHSGIPADDGSVPGFRTSTDGSLIEIDGESNFHVSDITLKMTITGAGSFYYALRTFDDETYFVGCMVIDSTITNEYLYGIGAAAGAGTNVYVINCLVHNIAGEAGILSSYNGDIFCYNCTVVDSNVSFSRTAGTATARNCGSSTAGTDFDGTWTQQTNDVDTPSFVDSGNDDFHLQSGDTEWKDNGTDLSADSDFAFDDDIDEEARSGSWDIGFDEVVAVGGLSIPVAMAGYRHRHQSIG